MRNKSLLFSLITSISFMSLCAFAGSPLDRIPIQDRGRVKPLQSFSNEMLQLIHGSKTLRHDQMESSKAKKVKREPSEIILTFMLAPEQWENTPIIRIDRLDIKKALGFPETQKYFSISEVFKSSSLQSIMQELENKRQRKEKLNPYDQALQKLETQMGFIRLLQTGEAFKIVPPQQGSTWLSINEMDGNVRDHFKGIIQAMVTSISAKMSDDQKAIQKANQELESEVGEFIEAARKQNPEVYAQNAVVKAELRYNTIHPFKWAWIFYFLSLLIFLTYWIFNKEQVIRWAWLTSFAGLAFHIYGFALRTYISGRAPVTNMYETVVWVPLGAVIFGMAIEYFKRNHFTLMAANLGAFLCLLLADMAPTVLDPTIQPLEPVLRSNFWLSTHVTTIVISYSAFFLAFVLADINLFYFATDPKKKAKKIKTINDSIYRAMQIGVLLLAIGIVLGGVWADYSWGRFWGWDPKETWALIALLGYLAVLHARLVGWLKQFGTTASAVASFSLVIMAWYGVNYVLGAGLHSYGFGAGGLEYVTAFILLHFVYVIVAWMLKTKKLNA